MRLEELKRRIEDYRIIAWREKVVLDKIKENVRKIEENANLQRLRS